MKHLKFIPFAFLLAFLLQSCGDSSQKETVKKEYESVENDPLSARIYTLDNGLKVYLTVNKDEPRIQTFVAVRTGSKQDPSDATGLAHYLEHMLFKGTSKIGTTNWEEEQKLLQQISDLYEEHRNTTDPEMRKEIYGKIDSISGVAARLAVPNEYDKMIESLGAKGTNAFTSLERTVYLNDIPSNELEKWLQIESERFSELVLRLFHTELEAVYEEFNRAQDNDFFIARREMMKNLYPNHTYGTQTTIGTGEHLKNPSMVKIHEYFKARYVPNNMAIALSGDFDPDEAFNLIKKYFGEYQSAEVPKFTYSPQEPITEPIVKEVYGSNAEFINMGFRLDGANSKDAIYLDLFDGILNNGQAGLIDLNLVQKQLVLNARTGSDINEDYSSFFLSATPREGQSLDEVKNLLLDQIELVKKGEFDDWLIDAVVKDLKLSETRQFERNWLRGYKMVDAFILNKEWGKAINELDEMAKITKEDLVKWANEKFQNNYVVVNKRIGEKDIFKVEKPKITPIDIDREKKSEFYTKIDSIETPRLKPLFLDYDKAIKNSELNSGIPFAYIENNTNEVFQLNYILDMGSNHDKDLELAVEYLPYLGTDKYTAEELQKEFFKLGLSFDVFTSDDRVYVTLTGLEDALEQGVQLFEEFLKNAKPDEKAYTDLVNGILKERVDNKLSKWRILNQALVSYARYGSKSPLTNIYSEEELHSKDYNELAEKIKSLTSYKHRIFYYGRKAPEEVTSILNKLHQTPEKLVDYPAEIEFTEQDITENQVYFVDYDMVQTEMMMVSKGPSFNPDLMPQASLFNEYFGSGLSSIVFQEIRESKALAYSAYCFFTTPSKKENAHYVRAYIGTQVDKLDQASDAMLALMNEMPQAEIQFEDSRLAALKKIESERITKTSVFWNYERAKRRGLDHDARKDSYEALKTMTMTDMNDFFNENIKGKNYVFLVIGKKKDMDFSVLKKLGTVKELQLEEIFGY